MAPRDFCFSATTPDAGGKHYGPPSYMCRTNVVMLVVGIGVMLWLTSRAVEQARWLHVGVLLLAAVLMGAGLAYVATVRVTIDKRTIERTWLGGRRVIVLEDIGKLGLSQYQGTVSLVIRGRQKGAMRLSSDTFDWQDIRRMHRDILLALGLDSEPMWPQSPRYLGFLDVEQVLRYKRFQAETSMREAAVSAEDPKKGRQRSPGFDE
jgi:hypothetical protein